MAHRTELTIPAQSTVALQAGSLHLMLMEAKKPHHAGAPLTLTLTLTLIMTFPEGKEIPVVVVRSGQKEDKQATDHPHMH